MKTENTTDLKNQNLPADSFNANLTAIPKGAASAADASADPDLVAAPMDFGPMNEKEARESGYIGKDGRAVSKSRKNVKGSPTGAYTDIGAGRSSAVVHASDEDVMEKTSVRSNVDFSGSQKQMAWIPYALALGIGAWFLRSWPRLRSR